MCPAFRAANVTKALLTHLRTGSKADLDTPSHERPHLETDPGTRSSPVVPAPRTQQDRARQGIGEDTPRYAETPRTHQDSPRHATKPSNTARQGKTHFHRGRTHFQECAGSVPPLLHLLAAGGGPRQPPPPGRSHLRKRPLHPFRACVMTLRSTPSREAQETSPEPFMCGGRS